MAELHVYYNEVEHYVAESIDDAWKLFEEQTGEKRADYEHDDPFEVVPDDQVISILCDEDGAISDSGTSTKLTAKEWAAREGRGLLCSSEY